MLNKKIEFADIIAEFPRKGSIKDLAESMRQQYWDESNPGTLLRTNEKSRNRVRLRDNNDAGYKPPPFGGNIINKSGKVVYVAGEKGISNRKPTIIAVPDGESDPPWFDADFFRCCKWYKIVGGVRLVRRDGKTVIEGQCYKVSDKQQSRLENALIDYLSRQ